ncbi:squamosa promoter-binding 3 [Chlorella sorokiniana]|uniref:Squamosa promoter-binding 3 n=1 Tax=Chlorella sorokiniana TaxID=3076 RepID=A0A2P6TMI6_CHLSO|nr:squamosa promoter-binding 3 [Chlorella sorokiniana]|eukprot:PRW45559.1 squamosa promoter-binding 3 [Chlorella sorokiniana]
MAASAAQSDLAAEQWICSGVSNASRKRRGCHSCQVPGCTADLSSLRRYFRRQRICVQHAQADAVPDGRGSLARFCQQCTRLEPLEAFYGRRRSCRASLARRQQRLADGKAAAQAHGRSTAAAWLAAAE